MRICIPGFRPDGYQVKLLDTPGMGHELCGPKALRAALEFVGGRTNAVAAGR